MQFYEGQPFNLDLPAAMDMTVVETQPAIKGATVTNVTKPAKLETGLVVQVPPSSRKARRFGSTPPTAATKAAADSGFLATKSARAQARPGRSAEGRSPEAVTAAPRVAAALSS